MLFTVQFCGTNRLCSLDPLPAYRRVSSVVFFVYFIYMRSLATLTRTTKRGLTSTWYFVQAADGFYAFGGCHKPLIKRFDSVDDLRALYTNYVSYGYELVRSSAVISDPWESKLPVDMQLQLDLLAA